MVLTPSKAERARIEPLVRRFLDDKRLVATHLNSLLGYIREHEALMECIHSIRYRVKEPSHLRDKLIRKLRECEADGTDFDISTDNLFAKITDLAGIRLLHLHSKQVGEIDKYLKAIVREQPIALIEGPSARTWDDENRTYFQSIGIETQASATMYTSVHYIIVSDSPSKPPCEVQVRTLMEEVWGEVDHKFNYPHPSKSLACREQIRALARATSTATRLVDAIFATSADFEAEKKRRARRRAKTKRP